MAQVHHGERGEDDEYEHADPVFTTRPDTDLRRHVPGAGARAPRRGLAHTDARRDEVEPTAPRRAMDLVSRKKTDKEKTGVFTGGVLRQSGHRRGVEVWIADYVLMEYGTGAIMAVPGHDERDFEFATQFGLPIVRVIAGEGDDAGRRWARRTSARASLVNSGEFDGMPSARGKRADHAVAGRAELGEERVNYRLHDWCISRQRYWGPPIPIIYCDACGTVPVPEDHLPVVLPHVENYKPDESGVSPLARVEEWYRVDCPSCGGEARRETDVSDTFLDSAWYFLRYPSANRDDRAVRPSEITEVAAGGHVHRRRGARVLHLLYARFITMVLHDLGHIDFEEPFERSSASTACSSRKAPRCRRAGATWSSRTATSRSGAPTRSAPTSCSSAPTRRAATSATRASQGPFGFLSRLWDTVVPATSSARARHRRDRAEAARHHRRSPTTSRRSATTPPSPP
jgi:leucyl-tRNA synthetase